MPPSEDATFKLILELKTNAKTLKRQAKKAADTEKKEKLLMEKDMKRGRPDLARIHAEIAIRKQNEELNMLQLAARVDAVAARVQTASTVNTLTRNIAQVNKAMEFAMKTTNLERVSAVMDGFEKNFNDLDVVDEYTREATSSATAVAMPQDDVDRLMAETADKVGVELSQDLQQAAAPAQNKVGPTEEQEQGLSERLRALRS